MEIVIQALWGLAAAMVTAFWPALLVGRLCRNGRER